MPHQDSIDVFLFCWIVDVLLVLMLHLQAGKVVEESLKCWNADFVESLHCLKDETGLTHLQDTRHFKLKWLGVRPTSTITMVLLASQLLVLPCLLNQLIKYLLWYTIDAGKPLSGP
jgi:hypothetical protein